MQFYKPAIFEWFISYQNFIKRQLLLWELTIPVFSSSPFACIMNWMLLLVVKDKVRFCWGSCAMRTGDLWLVVVNVFKLILFGLLIKVGLYLRRRFERSAMFSVDLCLRWSWRYQYIKIIEEYKYKILCSNFQRG